MMAKLFPGNTKSVETLIFTAIFSGTAFKGAYGKKEVDCTTLSRCLEEGSTLPAALIPWNTAGTYIATIFMGIFIFKKGQTSMKAAKK